MKLPNQIGNSIRPKALESEISSALLAQKEVLARGPIKVPHNAQKEVLARGPIKVPHNALVINSASKVMEAFNTSLSNVAKNHALNQSQNIGLSHVIGNVISQTAAANNSEKLNRKPGPPIEK